MKPGILLTSRRNGKTAAMEADIREQLLAGREVLVIGPQGMKLRKPSDPDLMFDAMDNNRDDWDRQVRDSETDGGEEQ